MKIIRIVFFSFLGLAILLAAAGMIFIKTIDVNRYKPQILAEAQKALGRKLDYQKAFLGISLTRGVNLKISGLSIAEDPDFGKDDFFFAGEISAGVDVLGYLLRKEISVSRIQVDSFRVNIIRNKDGNINLQNIARPGQSAKALAKASPATAAVAIPAIMISAINFLNGQVIYTDNFSDPAMRLEANQINVRLSGVSLGRAFPFAVSAAVLSDKKDITAEGKVKIDPASGRAIISGLKGSVDLASILLKKIPQALPAVKGEVLPKRLAGTLNFGLEELTLDSNGPGAFTADAELADGELELRELAVPVRNIVARLKITDKKISLDSAGFKIGQGLASLAGSSDDYPGKQDFSGEARIQDLNLQEIVSQEKSPVRAEGIASLKLNIKGSGFTREALKAALSGNADIGLVQARLKDLNVLRAVLDKISVLPGLAQRIEAGLPEKYKQKLGAKDTVFSDINLPVIIANGRLVINDLSLAAEEFWFKGSGQSSFSGEYSLEGALYLPEDLSASMTGQVPELEYLRDENKRIFIPLKVSGNSAETKFKVDGQYIARKIIQNQARQQIFKALEKSGGSGSLDPGAVESPSAASGQDSGSGSSTEEVVGSILRGIFK